MVKKLLCLLLLVAVVIRSPAIHAFAESGGSYQSKAGVGFTGEYEYPDESGENGSTAGNHADTSDEGSTSSKEGENKSILPPTGDTASSQTVLLGLLLITFAFLLIYKKDSQKSYKY